MLKATKPQLLSLKPQLLKLMSLPVLQNKRSHCNEKPEHHKEERLPLAAPRERPWTVTKTQHSYK